MRATLIIACALCLIPPLGAAASVETTEAAEPSMQSARPTHPDVGDTAQTCASCHAEVTPAIHAAWYAGAHGLNNVQCFVCHGSTTERFAVQVTTDRCDACHSAQAESMKALGTWVGMESPTCFSCHPPHGLSPHVMTAEPSGPTGREEGGTR